MNSFNNEINETGHANIIRQTKGKNWTTTRSQPIESNIRIENSIFNNRSKNVAIVNKNKERQSTELKTLANNLMNKTNYFEQLAIESRIQKNESREAYQRRLDKRKETFKKSLNNNQLLYIHNKRHECKHGYKYNIIKKGKEITFQCDHDICYIRPQVTMEYDVADHQCPICGSTRYKTSTNKSCGCSSKICTHCKRSRYVYDYGESSCVQFYDKHSQSMDMTVITIDNKDKEIVDMEQFLKKNTKTIKKSTIDRENFYRTLSGEKPVLYSQVVKEETVETKIQGGSMSVVESARNSYEEVRDKIKNVMVGLRDRIKTMIDKLIDGIIVDYITTKFKDFMMLIYDILSIMIYYLPYINLYNLYDFIQNPTITRLIYMMFMNLTTIKLAEEQSRNKIMSKIIVLSKGNYAAVINKKEFLLEFGETGVLTAMLQHILLYILKQYDITYFQLITLIPHLTIFRTTNLLDTVKTILVTPPKSINVSSLTIQTPNNGLIEDNSYRKKLVKNIEVIKSFFSIGDNKMKIQCEINGYLNSLYTHDEEADTYPQSSEGFFSSILINNGISMKCMTIIAKEILPILNVLRSGIEIGKYFNKFVEIILTCIFGEDENDTLWFNTKLYEEDNPLNNLIVSYVAYQSSVSQASSQSSELRIIFQNSKTAAIKYMNEQKKLHLSNWNHLMRKIDSDMSVPPLPVQRKKVPFVIAQFGAPGLGKSTFWKLLASSALRKEIDNSGLTSQEYIDKYTYTWNPATEYQVGMSSAKIILYDDLGQDRENVNDITSLISLVTTAPYVINSPNIVGPEIKGMTVDPLLIIVNTNATLGNLGNNLLDKSALERRLHLSLIQTDRYEVEATGKQIYTVQQSTSHRDFNGLSVSLEGARTLSYILRQHHLDNDTELNSNIDSLMQINGLNLEERPTQASIFIGRAWTENKNVQELLRKYNVVARKNTINTVVQGFFSDFMYQNTLQPISEYLIAADSWMKGKVWNGCNKISSVISDTFIHLLENNYISKLYSLIKENAKKIVKTIIYSITTIGTFYSILKLTSTYWSKPESGTERTSKRMSRELTVPQMYDITSEKKVTSLIEKATVYVEIPQYGRSINALLVGGFYMLIPKHFFIDFVNGGYLLGDFNVIIHKSSGGLPIEFKFNNKDIVELSKEIGYEQQYQQEVNEDVDFRLDAILYKLDNRLISASRDIVTHFWDGGFNIKNRNVCKIDYIHSEDKFIYCQGNVTKDFIHTIRNEGNTSYSHYFAQASYIARDASCGSAVKELNGKILGIHIAATVKGNKSMFHFITKQMLVKAMEDHIDIIEDFEVDLTSRPTYIQGDMNLEHCGNSYKSVYQSDKTTLKQSQVYDFVDILDDDIRFDEIKISPCAPSVLSHKDKRIKTHCTLASFNNYHSFWNHLLFTFNRSNIVFKQDIVDLVRDSMIDDLSKIKKKSVIKSKILTLHECINGIEGIPGNTSMDMSTSPGYPYVQEGLTKNRLFERIGNETKTTTDTIIRPGQRIIEDFKLAEEQIKQGKVPFLPGVIALKDEKLKMTKINNLKTRVFINTNVIHYLIFRKYFYTTLMQYYHADLDDSFCVPSLDRLSLQWHELIEHITTVGFQGFDFDFTNWDRNITRQLIIAGMEILLSGIDITNVERQVLIELIAAPYLIQGNNVFKASGTISSGVLITYMLNCVINEMLHRMAYIEIMRKEYPPASEIRHYREYVRGIRGGDDTITMVDHRVLEYYNGISVSQYFLDHGLKVTAADKDSSIVKSNFYSKLSFLKNTTARKNGMYIPQPDIRSLLESARWIRTSAYTKDEIKATQDNVICSLRGIYFYGKEFYNKVRNFILIECEELQLPHYDELDFIFNSYYSFPGAHSDWASRELQIDPFVDDSSLHHLKNRICLSQRIQNNMNCTNKNTTQTTPQAHGITGKDQIEETSNQFKLLDVIDPVENAPPKSVEEQTVDLQKSNLMQTGTTIQDSSTTVVTSMRTGTIPSVSRNDRAQAYANDVSWDLQKIEHKFTHVGDYSWKITDTAETQIVSLSVPNQILVTPAQKTPFDVTKLWKCSNVHIKVVVKAPPVYQGGLVIVASPLDSPCILTQAIEMGGMIYNIAQDQSVSLNIPFRYPVGYISLSENNILANFRIFVLSPLSTVAQNDNSVLVSVYASIEGSQFKIPEVIENANYYSKKLDGKSRTVVTYPQMSSKDTSINTLYCDINSPIQEMPKTKLCAGEGIIGKTEIAHFQDVPTDLVQLLKRFRRAANYSIDIPSKRSVLIIIPGGILYEAALLSCDRHFAFSRGSINVRVKLNDNTRSAFGTVRAVAGLAKINQDSGIEGFHYFDHTQLGVVTVPWLSPTFVAATFQAYGPQFDLHIRINNLFNQDLPVGLSIDLSAGDDFHMGVFKGFSSDFVGLFRSFELSPANGVSFEEIPLDYIPLTPVRTGNKIFLRESIPSRMQGGFMEDVDQFMETTVNIVDTASKLSLLLDATQLTVPSTPMQQRNYPFGVASDLPLYTERLLVTNHNGTSLPDQECFGVAKAETNIYNLLRDIKSLYSRNNWNITNPSGTKLFAFNIGPKAFKEVDLDSHLSRISSMASYYNGSILLMVQVYSTMFHTGQLLFAFTPNSLEELSYIDATQTYFTTMDISAGKGTICLMLPYISEAPYKFIPNGGQENFSSIGRLTCFVQNPLRGSNVVPASVEIITYIAAGEDYKLGVYGNNMAVSKSLPSTTQYKQQK